MADSSEQQHAGVLTGWAKPQVGRLPGGRLHLQHGPIDLVIKPDGALQDQQRACHAAIERFQSVLTELTEELPLLRQRLGGTLPPVTSPIARRMVAACWPYRGVFITPMAAVAGSVADEMRDAMLAAAPALVSLHVNNGGDIALHATGDAILRIGLVADLQAAAPEGAVTVRAGSGIGGIATSGWRGRSFSLGIADAVTVLARCAAEADAAATIIANAVDVRHPAIVRAPARSLDPDSDLGDLPVTTDVGALPRDRRAEALQAGLAVARALQRKGLIIGTFMSLQGDSMILGGNEGMDSKSLTA